MWSGLDSKRLWGDRLNRLPIKMCDVRAHFYGSDLTNRTEVWCICRGTNTSDHSPPIICFLFSAFSFHHHKSVCKGWRREACTLKALLSLFTNESWLFLLALFLYPFTVSSITASCCVPHSPSPSTWNRSSQLWWPFLFAALFFYLFNVHTCLRFQFAICVMFNAKCNASWQILISLIKC